MTKELVFLSVQPDETYFSWQIEIFIDNIRSLGYKEEIQILLLYTKKINERNLMLSKRYFKQNVNFFWYKETDDYINSIQEYIPLLRLRILEKHFTQYPELSQKAVFYHDSDIIFTKKWNIKQFKNDDINYLSDTSHYMSAYYFESRWRYVKPELLLQYQQINPLVSMCKMINIDPEIVRKNEHCTGGAQYILKNITSDFWKDVYEDAIKIRLLFKRQITPIYFEKKEQGFADGWCADMWALLWNLWKRNKITVCPDEMKFSWPNSPIEDTSNILHYTGDTKENADFIFHKKNEKYLLEGKVPFDDDLSYVSNEHCSFHYKNAIEQVKNKYYSNLKRE